MDIITQEPEEEDEIAAILISADNLSKVIRIPDSLQYEIHTELDGGGTRKYLYIGLHDGIFSKSQIIRVYKEEQ